MNALVLSAGGMFGAWQAGAWLAVERVFQPELVVGASVGALNGWMIARGASAAEIAARWCGLTCFTRPRLRLPHLTLGGLFDPGPLEGYIRSIFDGEVPRLPLGVVCTETPRLRPALFRNPEITWRHLAASCAVPLLLPAYRLNGRYYWDGGLLCPLPLWAAARMGARRIVAIDVMSSMPRSLRWPATAVRAALRLDLQPPRDVEVLVLSPGRLLGGWQEAACWQSESANRWLAEGEREGTRRSEEIRSYLAGRSLSVQSTEAN